MTFFIVGEIFFWRFGPIDVRKLLKYLCYFNWVSNSIILSNYGMYYHYFCFFWRILSHVYLAILFWNLFYYAQNNVDSKFVYFASLVQLFYSCIFVWFMLDQFLLLIFCFYHMFIKFIPFIYWSFNASSHPRLGYYFVFSFFHCFNWCMFV